MRSLSLRAFLYSVVTFVALSAFAHDITITGTQSFASLDGSSSDHDGASNGVFTVNDGNLTVNGTVNCNDGLIGGPCAMTFNVSGNMTLNAGSALYSEDRLGTGSPASITLNVGGNLVVNGTAGATPGAIVSTAALVTSIASGGNVTANVTGSTSVGAGATIDASSYSATAGKITVNGAGPVSIDGNLYSGPSRAPSGLMGGYLSGGGGLQKGGEIVIKSTTFAEPAVLIGGNAAIITQGENSGTGPITVDGCGIEVKGLIASTSRFNTSSRVSIRSGKNLTVDSRDLGVAGATLGRKGSIRADGMLTGSAENRGVDLFAGGNITILGPAAGSSSIYPISSSANGLAALADGGTVRIIALDGGITASGRVADASSTFTGGEGGDINVASKATANLDTAHLRAIGQYALPVPGRSGGDITVRSHSGNVVWTNGNGDVRPIGSTSGLPPSQQGTITLTACGTVNTSGTTFPANGVPTGVFPVVTTGSCSPAAPSLPVGVPPLVTCNTPPVANDTSASTNEDTTVTITLSGSDADGDSLTFSIVTGPSNGSLGPIIPTGPTTATVDYTPNLNFNGSDSFVYQANDGNGGTDNATATITVAPVNDPPTFLAGPTVIVIEDSGPQTYANWATSISPGPANEAGQTVTFTVTNDNNALFSVQPALAPNGTLTFTPAANANGSATITVVAQDNGGTANGGNDTSAPQTSAINVTPVNDEPSFTDGGNVSVNEDSDPYSAAWASAISAGPANESGQSVSFVVSNDNNALFSAQPAVSPSGVLTFTPAANANGSATVTVYAQDDGGTANGGDDTSAAQTFTITVGAVNDAPSFTSGGDVTVLEDSGAYSAAWATGISAGPADESGQTVSFVASNDNNALFAVQPSISPSGVLTFTTAANAHGTATVTVTLSDNGGTANGGVDTSAPQTFTLTITAVNDEPSFTAGGNVTVNEDSGAYSATWATAISAGPNEGSQTVTFVVSNDNNALFAAQPAIDASGNLTFTPAADANGTATVTVYLTDDGGTANGGDDTSASVTFTITVNAVNDAPSFTSGGNVTVLEDSGAYSAAWATGISAGPANESGQTVTFNTSNDNNALFAVQPSISPSGVLTFTLASDAFGSATVTVTLSDDGGTANGGVDTSAPQTFTITVNGVNDAPSFTGGGNITVAEDSGAYSAAWATGISTGPANESGQTVAFSTSNNNNALFSAQPSISPAGVLTFTPAPNAFGTATVTVTLSDNGGTANGGVDTSAPQTFTITVTSVPDAPVASNDSWETEGNTELRVDVGSTGTPFVGDTTPSTTGVLDNDSDPIEGNPISITGVVGCADGTAPYDCAVTGGTVSLNSNGSFSFLPSPGATSGSFQYTLTNGLATATGTVSITVHDMIWYVNGSAPAGGDGTSDAPFNSLASLNGVGDVDGAGDYIFVHTSNVAGSIALEASQKFWGQGIGLIIPRNLNGNGFPTTLVAPGLRPTVTAIAGDTVLVSNVTGVEIAGLNLVSPTGNGIDVTSAALTPASATIYSNGVTASGGEGIDINAGSSVGTTVSINTTDVVAMGDGVNLLATDGAVVFSYSNGSVTSMTGSGIVVNGAAADSLVINGMANVTVGAGTPGQGISVNTARFDANAGTAAFETINAGTWNVATSGSPAGGNAVSLTNVSGDIAWGALNAFGNTGGVIVGGTGAYTGVVGMRVTNTGGAIRATNGVGLSVTSATIAATGLTFTSIASANAANGIVLSNTGAGGLTILGDGTLARNGSGGTINNISADGVQLVNANNVTLRSMNFTNTGANPPSVIVAQSSAGSHAIDMNGGSSLVLSGVLIDNPRGSGLLVLNAGGTNRVNHDSLITNLTAMAGHGIYVNNANTNMTLFEFDDSAMTNNASLHTNFFFANTGTSNMRLDVINGSVFENLATQAVTAAAGGTGPTTGTLTTNIGGPLLTNGNTFRNGAAGGTGENNVGILVGNGASHVALVQNNLFDNVAETGLIANTSILRTVNNGGRLDAIINQNTIQNINYAAGTGGRHVIGHIFEPIAFNASDYSNVEISGNVVTGVTFAGTNREFIFMDYRPNAAGGKIKILNNDVTFTNAGTQQAMELRFRQTNASTVNLQIDGNVITHDTAVPFIDIDAEAAATVNSTVTNNDFNNPNAAPGQMIDVATESATAVGCANISGNNLTPGSITINEILGTLNVTQASSAALAAANGGAVVTVGGSPAFGQPACALP